MYFGNNYYYQIPNGAETAEILGLQSLFIRKKRSDHLVMFKILIGSVEPRTKIGNVDQYCIPSSGH